MSMRLVARLRLAVLGSCGRGQLRNVPDGISCVIGSEPSSRERLSQRRGSCLANSSPSQEAACAVRAAMDLETAIAAQVGTTPPEEITQLVLDACKATKVSGLEKFVNLRELTINGCGLTSLEGFPTLAKLEVLQLNDNQLTDGCLEALQDAGLLTLHTLSLAGNRFSTLESLEPLVRPHLFATSRPLFARARSLRSLPSSSTEPPSLC